MIADTIGMQLHMQSVDIDEAKKGIEDLSKKLERMELAERTMLNPDGI